MKSNNQITQSNKNILVKDGGSNTSIHSLKNIQKENSIMNHSTLKSTKNPNPKQVDEKKPILKSQSQQLINSQGLQLSRQASHQKSVKMSIDDTIESQHSDESSVSSQASVQSLINPNNAKRNKILNFIIFLCESELYLEKLRQKVCSFEEFEPYAVFQRFNRNLKKELQAIDISNFMESLNEKIDIDSIKILMWFYDLDRSNSLSYIDILQKFNHFEQKQPFLFINNTDINNFSQNLFYQKRFMTILVTTEDDDLRTKISVRPTYKVGKEEYMPMHMEVTIGKLFYQLIQYFDKIEEFRSQLEKDFNIEELIEAFNYLDKEGKGEINEETLIDFLREQSYDPSSILAKNILRNFKGQNADFIEKDEDYIIGYDANGNPIYKKEIDKMKFLRFLVPNMSKDVLKHALDLFYKSKQKIPVKDKYNFEIRKEWLEIFKQRVEPEKEIEYCKQDLAMQKDFSAKDMFTLINSDQNEYISMKEFVDSLKELGVQPFKDELYLFFRRHAANKRKGLRENEFYLAILPNQHTYDEVATNRVVISKENMILKMKDLLVPETLRRFKKLMIALLKFELKIEAISLKLAKLNRFAYEDFFELLDSDQKGYVTITGVMKEFNIQELIYFV